MVNDYNLREFEIIVRVKQEVKRFNEKLEAMQELLDTSFDRTYKCKERAQMKRSALDLKSELTKITQLKIY